MNGNAVMTKPVNDVSGTWITTRVGSWDLRATLIFAKRPSDY